MLDSSYYGVIAYAGQTDQSAPIKISTYLPLNQDYNLVNLLRRGLIATAVGIDLHDEPCLPIVKRKQTPPFSGDGLGEPAVAAEKQCYEQSSVEA